MQDLRAAVKGGVDPNGVGSSVVAADVLWSDPVAEPGLRANAARGVGLIFGPDITQVPMRMSSALKAAALIIGPYIEPSTDFPPASPS